VVEQYWIHILESQVKSELDWNDRGWSLLVGFCEYGGTFEPGAILLSCLVSEQVFLYKCFCTSLQLLHCSYCSGSLNIANCNFLNHSWTSVFFMLISVINWMPTYVWLRKLNLCLIILFSRLCSVLSCNKVLENRTDTVADFQYIPVLTKCIRKITDVLLKCVQYVSAPYILVKYCSDLSTLFMYGIC
jgi:hypothetical protein